MPFESEYFNATGLTPEEEARRARLKTYLAPKASPDIISSPQYSTATDPNLLDENEFLRQMTGEDITTPEPVRTVAATPKAKVTEVLKKKFSEPEPRTLSADDEAIMNAEERADNQKFRSGLSMGIQQIIGAVGGVEPNTKYQESQYAGADKKAGAVREYILNKRKHEKELQALKSDQAYKNRMIQLQEAELGLKDRKQSMELPDSEKAAATALATKVANKVAITQQIDSYLKQMEGADEDMQKALGEQMIKVLNSTEGQDAVGADERRVLAQKLKNVFFSNFNPFSDAPTQWGRDIPGFIDQATKTSNALKDAAAGHKTTLEGITGSRSRIGIPERTMTEEEKSAARRKRILELGG